MTGVYTKPRRQKHYAGMLAENVFMAVATFKLPFCSSSTEASELDSSLALLACSAAAAAAASSAAALSSASACDVNQQISKQIILALLSVFLAFQENVH